MCKIYGLNLGILLFYENQFPQVQCIILHKLYDKFVSILFLCGQLPHFIHHLGMYRLRGMTSIYNMEKRYCKMCNSTKDADLFYEDRKYCVRCLDKEKEKHQRHREKRLEYFEKYYEV